MSGQWRPPGDGAVDRLIRRLPMGLFWPCRAAAVRLPRGNPIRSAAVLTLKRVARAWRHRLAERLTEIRPLDAPRFSFAPSDSMVMEAVHWFGAEGYEGRVGDVWAFLCREAGSVLEIGGNVGFFTVLGGAACRGRYTVVEPVPEVASVLRANLARNGLAKVEVLEAAAIPGPVARDVVLNIPDEGRAAPVGAHLTEGVEVSGRGTMREARVPGVPIADLAAGRDLIKIDAEGIEAELLAVLRPMLVASRPDLIVEVWPEAERLAALLAALAREAGYTIHVLPEYGSDTIARVAPEDFDAATPGRYRSKDVLLSVRRTIPREKHLR